MNSRNWQIRIADIMMATFWVGILTAVLIANWRLYFGINAPHEWVDPRTQQYQLVFTLASGTAVGGAIGSMCRHQCRGAIGGLAVASIIAVIWIVFIVVCVPLP